MPHPFRTRGRLRLLPLPSALHAAMLGLSLGTPFTALADSLVTTSSTVHSYAIGGGPLALVLASFADQAGITLSFASTQVQGLRSPGLNGEHDAGSGLALLLSGTGLAAEMQRSGSYVLRTLPRGAGDTVLSEVRVVAASNARTEGSGSYASAIPLSTATPLGLTQKDTPQSVSVVTRQQMDDQGLTTIREALRQTPGIVLAATGTERFQAASRGYQITNYQFDGVSSHSDYGGAAGPASQSLADMIMYDRIELVRGASGLVTGAGDPSGVINMVRKRPTDTHQVVVEASAASWQGRRGSIDASAPLNANGTLRARVVGAIDDSDSHIDHYSHRKDLIYGVIDADLGARTQLTIGADHQQTRSQGSSTYVGFPLWFSNGEQTDLPVSTSLASRDNRFTTRSTTAFATLSHRLSTDWQLKLSSLYGSSSQHEESVYLEANGRFADKVTGDGLVLDAGARRYDTEFVTADAQLQGDFGWFGRTHQAVFGVAYEDYKKIADGYFDTSGLDGQATNLYSWNRRGKAVFNLKAIDWDAYREQYSFYGAGRFEVTDRLKLIAGARVINYEDSLYTANIYGYRYQPASSEHGVFAPYGGALYQLNDRHTAYASYSTIYQPQYARNSAGELIAPREGANYELGLKSSWRDARLSSAVAIYQIDQDNLTETDPAYILVPGTTSEYASRVIPGARTRGLDMEVIGALTAAWSITASYTYSRTENGDGKVVRTTFPAHLVKLWTTWRLPGALERVTVGGGANWQSRIHSSVNSSTLGSLQWAQDDYAVASVMARYDVSPRLSATLNVDNLLDRKYIASASEWWYSATYGEPRKVSLDLKYRF